MYKNRVSIFILFFITVTGFATAKTNSGTKELQNTPVQTVASGDIKIEWLNAGVGVTHGFYLVDTAAHSSDKFFTYGSFIRLPKFVQQSGDFKELNRKIATDFSAQLQQLKANPKPDENEYHSIAYECFLNDSIVTAKITDLRAYHLSEATTTFQIYHFDYKNNRLLNTTEIFEALGMSRVPVLNAFTEQCTLPPDYTEPLFSSEWFELVKWTDFNQLKFYLNRNKQLVIIYQMAENGIEDEQILK
jgi:hypothetical protein